MSADSNTQFQQELRMIAARSTESQRQFMEYLAAREREPKNRETPVDELEALGEPRPAAIQFFRDLAAAGCGQFLAGRRTKKTRLAWERKSKEVARDFLNFPSGVGDSESTIPQTNEQEAAPVVSHFHRHEFLLRPGVQVSIELPLDITTEESIRLADFVRALPFRASTKPSITFQENQS